MCHHLLDFQRERLEQNDAPAEFTARELRLFATGDDDRLDSDRREALTRAFAANEEVQAQVDFFRQMLGVDEQKNRD